MTQTLDPDNMAIGDPIHDSPVGSGVITDVTERGYPKVNRVAVAWCERPDGGRFDPHNHRGGSKAGTGVIPEGYVAPPKKAEEPHVFWPNSYAAGSD